MWWHGSTKFIRRRNYRIICHYEATPEETADGSAYCITIAIMLSRALFCLAYHKQLILLMLLKPVQLPKKQIKRELVKKHLPKSQQPKPLPQIDQVLKRKRRFVNK
jgi:hypothetical protein